jgi:hydrogenase-4 component B
LTVSSLLVLSSLVLAISGIPGLVPALRGSAGERLSVLLAGAGGIAGAGGALAVLCGLGPDSVSAAWSIVPASRTLLGVDPLSAAFLLPLFCVASLGSVYGLSYWPAKEHPASGPKLRFFFGLLAGSMGLVTMARDGVLFLVVWEVMALAAYFLITTEGREPDVRKAGWVYLIATHFGTLILLAMVLTLGHRTGSFLWERWEGAQLAGGWGALVFVLALVGFGFKAGLVPFHFWLPGAHASAPSHVSALLSAVMLKMGIYGFLRITSLLPEVPAWWGAVTLAVGVLTALTGVALAVAQGDLKRLLAYSSIENVGIVYVGIGTALVSFAAGRPECALLGLAGAVFHVWNHAVFKSLLFFSAGSVVHATGTREMDRMGGLLRPMPRTGLAFATGAAAVSGLPPLNGFVSEWLIYVALFRLWADGRAHLALAGFAIPMLAATGALATASFVKAFGTVFLGSPRVPGTRPPQEAAGMARVALILASGCVLLGVAAPWLTPMLERVAFSWNPALAATGARILDHAPLGWISAISFGLVAAVAVGAFAVRHGVREGRTRSGPTWDCGYAAPTSRMQYTGRSFSEWLGEKLLPGMLGPRIRRQDPRGLFPGLARFSASTPDPFHTRLYAPAFTSWADRLTRFRWLQQGRIGVYLLYILLTLMGLLAWSAYRGRF